MSGFSPGVAIVGISCAVPGARGAGALWEALLAGRETFVPLPRARFDPDVFAAEAPGGRSGAVRGALLESFDLDWRGLRIPPLQAERMHRLERIALTAAAGALADAGIAPGSGSHERGGIWVAGPTSGVDPNIDPLRRIRRFELSTPLAEAVAVVLPDRAAELEEICRRLVDLAAPPIEPDALFTSPSILAGRMAHLFDFRAGHLAVDAAMCSSLAAMERAAVALADGACDIALVCALAPLVTPSSILALAHRGALGSSPPRPFAPNGNGTLLGEGSVALVLKRFEDVGATERAYAVIEGMGSAAAPRDTGPKALARCASEAARRALSGAGLTPFDVELIESRASGVAEEDAAEAAGLAEAYEADARRERPVLSSSAACTGFLQAASGLMALAKAALALHHRQWPAQPGASALPETVAGLRTARAPSSWEGSRRAGVSDAGPGPFAYHAILATPLERPPPRRAMRAGQDEPIAIVGAGLLVPEANDLATFWSNALLRVDAVGDLPRSRWDVDRLIGSSAELATALRTRLAATVRLPPFEPARFGLRPGEAERDPAIALALLAAEQALADAGFRPGLWDASRVQVAFGELSLRLADARVEKRVLFAGHLALAAEAMRQVGIPEAEIAGVLANARTRFDTEEPLLASDTCQFLSGLARAARVAAAFGFEGGAHSVDAACASSLAALQIGEDALRRREADVVLAGGVAYNLLPEYYIALGLLGALSQRGGHPFHRDAEGFVPGEGAGVVVLKRLSDARASNDRIYAVIRGHGVSSDGRGRSIYTPSTDGQQLAIRRAFEGSGLTPADVDHLEAHGPGTRLGDRTEMESYAATYGRRAPESPLSISTAKSQVGHTTSAAGIIALVRAALAIHQRVLPPSNGSGKLDPELPFGRLPLQLPLEARPWAVKPGRSRCAAVSAFGLAGVNHHIILEDAAPAAAERSAPAAYPRPADGLVSDRFALDLVPVSIPDRQPSYPLRAKRILLVPDGHEVWRAVEATLHARGAEVSILPAGPSASAEEVSAAAVAAASCPDCPGGVIDLSTFDPASDLAAGPSSLLMREALRQAHRTFALLRAFYGRLSAPERGAFVQVTGQGGDLGISGRGMGNMIGAFHMGLVRSLKQELPGLLAKTVDFDPLERPEIVAKVVVREMEDGNDCPSIGWAGRRFVMGLRRSDLPEAPLRPLRPGDIWLFSGGGRGVVFECACALARLDARVVVTGRTPLPDPAAPWLALDGAAFAAFRSAEMARRRRANPSLTPARLAREVDLLTRQRELHANMARARGAGLEIEYEACDVVDAASVRAMVDRVRARHGRIDGLGHGAMIERSAAVPGKDPQTVERTLCAKVGGLLNLLDATCDDPLRFIVAFGSGVARFGNRGQTDYGGANALMAALLPARARSRGRPVHCVTIDWPAWQAVGWAASNAEIAAALDQAGVTSITPEEGCYWFLSELALGSTAESLLMEERMLHEWPFLGGKEGGQGERAVDDLGRPVFPGCWPMVDAIVERESRRIVLERTLRVSSDLFLPEHRLNGRPVVPATFACELLAEAALLAVPGMSVRAVSDFAIEAPMTLVGKVPLTVGVEALPRPEGGGWVVEVVARSGLCVKGRALEPRVHCRARVHLESSPPGPRRALEIRERGGIVRARSFYQTTRDPVALGPMFARTRWVQVSEREANATVDPVDLRAVFRRTRHPVTIIDPLLLDAAMQVAGSWDGYRNGWISVPMGFERLEIGGRLSRGERARALAKLARDEDPSLFYDLVITGEDDRVLAEVTGLHLRRVASVEQVVA